MSRRGIAEISGRTGVMDWMERSWRVEEGFGGAWSYIRICTGDTYGAGGVEYGARGSPLVRANIAATLCRRSSLPMAKITEGVGFDLGEAIGTLIRSQVQDLLRTSSSLIGGKIHLNQVVSDRVSGIFTS